MVLFDIKRVLVACRWLVYGERVVKVDENRANPATARAKQYVMSRESMQMSKCRLILLERLQHLLAACSGVVTKSMLVL